MKGEMDISKTSRIPCIITYCLAFIIVKSIGIEAYEFSPQSCANNKDVLPSASNTAFDGVVGPRPNQSTPSWPERVKAPANAPNVVVILIDDAGFGATSAFGGPIPTPNFDALSKRGLRYTQFHTTALCSPTRAALLTGRNHHTVHTGCLTDLSTGYPGYHSVIGKDTASVAEVLKLSGFNTIQLGKHHNTPEWEATQSGPFDSWPTERGFEHFYGFLGGDTNQYRPSLYEGIKPIEPYLNKPDYTLNEDLANQTIQYIRRQKSLTPDKPFLVYYAPGATHAPHHVPKEWIDRFKGKFDYGWDRQREMTFNKQKEMGIFPPDANLTKRPDSIPAWNQVTEDERKVYTRMMEVYAGFMAHTDHEIGRVLDEIKALGQEDNTLVMLMIGDNGASPEGALTGSRNEVAVMNEVPENFTDILENVDLLGTDWGYNIYPVGWAHALCTPFQYTKQVASHYGGIRNPLVISWPAKIPERYHGDLRTQWHHVIDVTPTILDAVGLRPPSIVNGIGQKPYEGMSMMYTFLDAKAKTKRKRQYFEMFGYQAIYDNGWMASTTPEVVPWLPPPQGGFDPLSFPWELYHVDEDPTQSVNLAKKYPSKLQEMRELFAIEAAAHNVYPIDGSKLDRFNVKGRPSTFEGRNSIRFYPGMTRTPESGLPDMKNKDFSLTTQVYLPSDKENGVLATLGGKFGGFSFYFRQGYLVFHYNWVDQERYEVSSKEKIGAGEHLLQMRFKYDGLGRGKGGIASLYVDETLVGRTRIHHTMGFRMSFGEAFDCGEDTGTAAAPDYDVPNPFTGKLHFLDVDI